MGRITRTTPDTLTPGQDIAVWSRTGGGQGGTFTTLSTTHLTLTAPGNHAIDYPLTDFADGTRWIEIETPYTATECVSYSPDCTGAVFLHSAGGHGTAILRCTFHADQREARYNDSVERYARHVSAPDWFDPSYAGETWDSEDY